uniref:Uncharacterized protein n=1 Tax=Lotus japonicus TaxID=34305 RepID=I3SSI3_LOTJA|nr:unknown [Lotus japonicus]
MQGNLEDEVLSCKSFKTGTKKINHRRNNRIVDQPYSATRRCEKSSERKKGKTKVLMLTKITMPIVFFKRFKTMRRGSFMEIGVEWNKVEFNGHRRHFLCSSIHPLTLRHPTKPNNNNKHPLILNLIQD